ncbi:AtpZ/AtpI family protein [Flavobacteriales bacterium]|nr:AtpZ/AtpI family protein [Flavobacteriales bacterium]
MKKNRANKIIQFSGIGLQMGILIYFGSILGKWIDKKYGFEKPIFTLIIIIFCFSISMYTLIKKLNKMNEKDES